MKLPTWMKEQFEKNVCPYCKKSLLESGVRSHGIQEERSKTKKKLRLSHFYQYKCAKCKNICTFSFPTSWQEFIRDIVDVAEQVMPPQFDDDFDGDFDQLVPPKTSGISDDEVNQMKKVMGEGDWNIKSFEDFLTKLGIDKEEKPKKDEDK